MAVVHESTKKWQWMLEADEKRATSRDARPCTPEGIKFTQGLNSRSSVVSKKAIKVNLMLYFWRVNLFSIHEGCWYLHEELATVAITKYEYRNNSFIWFPHYGRLEDVFVEFDKTSYNIQQHFFGLSASLSL